MKRAGMKLRSVLVGTAIAAGYMAALAAVALQVDRRSFQDQHVRSMQVAALLSALTPESFLGARALPRVFPWQRALLIDGDRKVLADSGWLENDSLTSGDSGSIFAKRYAEIAGLKRPPSVDEERITRLLLEAPDSGYFGLVDARTIGAGRAAAWNGKVYGIAILADKRDLIAAKHLDHVVMLVAFLLVLLLPATLIALAYARLVLPLNRLAGAVRAMNPAAPNGAVGRIELPGESRSDEIGLVSAAFGTALREARESGERLEEFVDDALHELKNPISSLRSLLELTRMRGAGADGAFALSPPELDRLLSDVGRTERLLGGLRALSAADSQEVAGMSRPSALLRDFVDAYSALGRRVALEDALPEDAALPIDPEAFSRLVRILVDNALGFSPPEAGATITAAAEDDYVTVRVADRGPGVPPNLREWVFLRFASTRKGRPEPHSGLGLAIAKSLVSRIRSEDRRASISVEDNPGGGAAFTLRLPRAARRQAT
jgi:two-component system, OmpR family, sensor kinase